MVMMSYYITGCGALANWLDWDEGVQGEVEWGLVQMSPFR